MIPYFLLYLVLGVALAVGGMIAWRKTPFIRRLLSVAALWLFWPLMVAAIIHEKWMLKKVSSTCAWCGAVIEDTYPAGAVNPVWIKHARECPNHPLRPEIDALKRQLEDAESQLRIYQLAGDDE